MPRLLMGLLATSEERALKPLGGACGGWGRGVADVEGLRPGSLHWGVASGGGVLQSNRETKMVIHMYFTHVVLGGGWVVGIDCTRKSGI